MRIVPVFDPVAQKVADHTASFESNGELVLTSTLDTGHFLKIDIKTIDTKEKLDALLEAYRASNEGQITLEQVEAEQTAVLDTLLGAEESTGAQSNDAATIPTP